MQACINGNNLRKKPNGGYTMRKSKNILTEEEMELVKLLMVECKNTGDIQANLKRLFAGAIEQMLAEERKKHLG